MRLNKLLTAFFNRIPKGITKPHPLMHKSRLNPSSRKDYKFPINNLWTSTVIFILNFILSQISICQTNSNAIQVRKELPIIKLEKSVSAVDYCISYGGSTSFERITSIHVVEKPGNLLDITVDVYIANPSGCQSGEPCPVYDPSPENVNVWIDWDGDQVWESHEKVLNESLTGYQNINYAGTMTAKITVEIPPNAAKPTWLRANLGWNFDPEDPCQVSWSWGNVVDQQVLWNIKVKEITATLNIDIVDVPKPLWQATYNESGGVISIMSNPPVAAGMKNGWFTLPVELVSFPENLGADSKTDCNWEILGTGVKGLAGITGKNGVISITLPQKLGFYDLQLKFLFKNNKGNRIGEQVITLPLWVSYHIPQLSGIKKIWLQKAIEWTEGSQMGGNIEGELATKIMNGIYSKSGWKYFQYNFLWSKLLDGQETLGGNCDVVANVWINLLKTLGVGGVSRVTHGGGPNAKHGFMVVPGYKAYGGLTSEFGNATDDLIFITYDRWIFDQHTFGQKGNTFYDPTFNETGTDKYYHVAHEFIDIVNGKRVSSPGGPTANSTGMFGAEGGFWPIWKYNFSSSNASPLTEISSLIQGARFTGSFSETSLDSDGDGIYNQLGANVGVEVTNQGNYIVGGVLRKDGIIITSRPYFTSPNSWFESIVPQTGQTEIQALFSGENIFMEAANGPYSIDLFITDTSGVLADTVTFNTSPYAFSEFGETPTRILQMSETATDTSGDGFFDLLSCDFNINASLAGIYSIQTTLLHQGQMLITENKNVSLNVGNNQLKHSLDVKLISISGFDGPYLLSLQVLDHEGIQTVYQEIQTAAYTASQFSKPIAVITGGSSDAGVDINRNGLFDSLNISINIESAAITTIRIIAWLKDQNNETITWTQSKETPDVGSQSIELSFPGADINKSQLNGPYKIGYAVITDDSSNLIFSGTDLYTTQNYSASQFEKEAASIISVTGNYSEIIIDSDTDGLIDSLVVGIEVIPRDSGNVVALGRLVDSENETIFWSSAINFLQENIPQMLQLKFDGRYIYGGLVNGPYYLKDLQIYHAGDPTQTIDIQPPYTTHNYNYTDFEKTGLITGTISDVNNNPVQSAFLIISDNDNDYSNNKGKYNLVLLNEGEFDLKIEGPDTLNIDWSIYLNGNLLKTGDSVRVSVGSNQIVNIDFKAPIIISEVKDLYSEIIPDNYYLKQNFPNPFNPITEIIYQISKSSYVLLTIYDLLGNKIADLVNEVKLPGEYKLKFDASNLTSGVYFYRLQTGEFMSTKKFVLMK